MSERWIRPSCVGLILVVWITDALTPQAFVVSILLNVPIAISSLALDSRFTRILVGVAMLADVSAAYVNVAHDHYVWESFAVANRVIAGLSFLLVGALCLATQRLAVRAGELAARTERATRERGIRRAVESVRSSINPELVRRAIVRESRRSLDADIALLYSFEPTPDETVTYRSEGDDEVEVSAIRPSAEMLSMLHRMAERDETMLSLPSDDPLGRLRLETLGADAGTAASLVEHHTKFGVLVLLRRGKTFEAHFEEALETFAQQAAIALAQARLFSELGQRNEELAVAASALRERGDVVRDLVYALSHDLRTPLVAARMTMQQALAGAFGDLPAAYREILERSLESNEELHRLAETLLLVSRYESGDRSVRRDPVDLARVATSVERELEPLAVAKTIAIRSALQPALVLGDESELRRAVVNLLANAITSTPSGGSIDVSVRAASEGGFALEIDDSGHGVPAGDRGTLFQRVRPGRGGAGSGLGLYLVRRIAESHGGNVRYAPRSSGGSSFVLELPAAAS